MDELTIHATFLPHDDPDASVAFYRDVLGFEVRKDVGYDDLRWITVGPPGQQDVSLVLEPLFPGPGVTDEERRTVKDMMAKGTYATLTLAAADVDAVFARIRERGGDVAQEPADQPWGARDCAFRDPAGTMIRITQEK